jgi:hypothetical protein
MRVLALFATLVAAGALTASAAADPSHNINPQQPLSCDNGMSLVVNPGTLTNQSHQAFDVNSTSIFVSKYLAFSNGTDTFVIFDTASGVTAQGLVTCTGDAGGGFTITVRGFLTPRT